MFLPRDIAKLKHAISGGKAEDADSSLLAEAERVSPGVKGRRSWVHGSNGQEMV